MGGHRKDIPRVPLSYDLNDSRCNAGKVGRKEDSRAGKKSHFTVEPVKFRSENSSNSFLY